MLAMHYGFVFDDDFDISAIRRRIAEKGPLFDHYPGLVQKAFLVNERDAEAGGQGRNEYATFYIWESAEAARRFLASDAFEAVSDSFGRPQVGLWPLYDRHRRWTGTAVGTALLEAVALPPDGTLDGALSALGALFLDSGRNRGLHSGALALDPQRWRLLRFTLWQDSVPAGLGEGELIRRYEVAHLSQPDNEAAVLSLAV